MKQTKLEDSWSVVSDQRNTVRIYKVLAVISSVSLAVIVYASYSVI